MVKTLLDQAKDLASQIGRRVRAIDVYSLPRDQQQLLATVRRLVEDLRLDVRDYQYADTLAEQTRHGQAAKDRAKSLQATILKASEYDLFGAGEVAELSAAIEIIADAL